MSIYISKFCEYFSQWKNLYASAIVICIDTNVHQSNLLFRDEVHLNKKNYFYVLFTVLTDKNKICISKFISCVSLGVFFKCELFKARKKKKNLLNDFLIHRYRSLSQFFYSSNQRKVSSNYSTFGSFLFCRL